MSVTLKTNVKARRSNSSSSINFSGSGSSSGNDDSSRSDSSGSGSDSGRDSGSRSDSSGSCSRSIIIRNIVGVAVAVAVVKEKVENTYYANAVILIVVCRDQVIEEISHSIKPFRECTTDLHGMQ